jgi:hypothetical protein
MRWLSPIGRTSGSSHVGERPVPVSQICLFLCIGPPAMPIYRFSVARFTPFAGLEPCLVLGGIFVCRGKIVPLW